MPREKITLTPEFKAAIKAYQKANNLASWSATFLHLAAIGYESETGHTPPGPIAVWGGKRLKRGLVHTKSCPDCHGRGVIKDQTGEGYDCFCCQGSGVIEEED